MDIYMTKQSTVYAVAETLIHWIAICYKYWSSIMMLQISDKKHASVQNMW